MNLVPTPTRGPDISNHHANMTMWQKLRIKTAHLTGLLATLAAMAIILTIGASPAVAVEFPYEFDPALSLTGDCSTLAPDTVPDPGCPYPPPPAGPAGRFNDPRSVAIDSYGNQYVASHSNAGGNGGIDIFDSEGFFIAEFAGGEDPTSVAVDSDGNVYSYEGKEIVLYAPTAYEPEAGVIQYDEPGVVIGTTAISGNGGLAIDRAGDRLYVAEGSKVRLYDSAVEGNVLLATISNPKLGSWSIWPAVDSERRRLYLSYCKDEAAECGILVLEADAPHAVLAEIDGSDTTVGEFRSAKGWTSVAVDEDSGHFFVEDLESTKNVYEYDAAYELASTLSFARFQGGNALQIGFANTPADPGARNAGHLFVPAIGPAGSVFAFSPPDVRAPEVIEGPAATSISESEAELSAMIAPNGAVTEYEIEYVSESAFEASGFEGARVVGSGTLPVGTVRRATAAVFGLSPGTAYRFRVKAENEAGAVEAEGDLSTYADPPIGGHCANDDRRGGPSAHLADCRAYELVTPSDTNGHEPKGIGFQGDRFATLQSSPAGEAVSFLVLGGALPGYEGAGGFYGDPYLARRGTTGWSTSAAGPSGAESSAPHPGSPSVDQGHRFWSALVSGSALVEGDSANYVRYPDGHSALVGRGSLGSDPKARGKLITEGGTHIVFQTKNVASYVARQLEPNAPSMGTAAVYDRTPDEVTHVVSLLPGNVTPTQDATYVASSPDGNGIVFGIGSKLYVRIGNKVTYEIGEGVELVGISEGGERVFYLEEGDLLAYDTASEEVIPFGESGDATVVNVAVGGERAYFVSPSVLTGEANPNGAVAQPGEQNLYLSSEGVLSFVGTLTDRDVEGTLSSAGNPYDGLGLWANAFVSQQPARSPSRLDPGGEVLLFQSRAVLDGFNPEGVPEIYRYSVAADELQCLSCIPTRQDGGEGASLLTLAFGQLTEPPFSPYGFVANLSTDGRRAFFESGESLVSYDTDGRRDVYEWEAQGVGTCTVPGGCVYLISSPGSEGDEYLFAHSTDGEDVFFVSADALAPGGGGTASIYDARVDGGFTAVADGPPCVGEACKPGLAFSPALLVPRSGATTRSSNTLPSKHRKRCSKRWRKVKRKGKVRCVAKHRKHRHTRHNRSKQAGRVVKGGRTGR